MKQFLTIVLQFCISYSYGQFAIVNDKDSLVNVRKDGLLNSNVIDQLPNGHLIYCFENKGNWTNIDYTKKGKELSGFIYKDRYKFVSDFIGFKVSKKSETSITIKKDTLEVTITQSKFDKEKHKFRYVKDYPDQIELIDNKKYWGSDGGMPTTEFEKVVIKAGRKIIVLPRHACIGGTLSAEYK